MGYKACAAVSGFTLGSGNLGNLMILGGVAGPLFYDNGPFESNIGQSSSDFMLGLDVGISYKIMNRFMTNGSYTYYGGNNPNALSFGVGIILY